MDTKQPGTPQNAGSPPADDPAFDKAVRLGHDTRDVSVRGLFIFAASLLVSLVVIFAGVFVLFEGYQFADRWLAPRRARPEPGAE